MNYEQHPIGACYPPLTVEEFGKLRASLHDAATKPPAILFEGKILDGWHYYKACLEEGVQPIFETPEIKNPIEFVIRRNEGRRQMDTMQRAKVASRLINVSWGGARASTQFKSQKGDLKITRIIAAQKMKVPVRAVDCAIQIQTRAIPEVQAAFEAKNITAGRAEDIARLPQSQQLVELTKWLDKKVKPRQRPNRPSTTKSKGLSRSELSERAHQMFPGKFGLTREQVDPNFNGSPMDWIDTYGHVQIMTKEELAADRKQSALMDSLRALNDLRLPLEKYIQSKPFELIELEAYISKSPDRRLQKLNEMISLISKVKERIEKILPVLNKIPSVRTAESIEHSMK